MSVTKRLNKYWLITYSIGKEENRVNEATKDHPADWLFNTIRQYPEENVVLHYAIEIDVLQYGKLGGDK